MIEIQNREFTMRIRGQLSRRTRGLFEGMLEQLLAGDSPRISVDLRHVTELDSDGAQALRRVRERLQEQGRSLVLVTR